MSQKPLSSLFNQPTNKIDTGLGIIEFNEPDNLLLQQLMENLEEAIKKYGAKKVNALLSSIN